MQPLENKINEKKENPCRYTPFISKELLNLSCQNLTDNDMPGLVKFLLNNPHIKVLDLSLNHIGDEGIAYFADRNQNIKQINFEGNNISDHGIALFAYKNGIVQQANFARNLISDQGIINFSQINDTCLYCQFSVTRLH
jgi:hypothetical protein